MDIRGDAHRLLDELDEDQLAAAAELLRNLVRQRRPLDDEPATPSRRQPSFIGMISAEPDLAERSAEILRQAVRASRGRTQQEVVIEALQEYIRHHEDERQRIAAIEDGLALLLSGDLDHPDRDSAWH